VTVAGTEKLSPEAEQLAMTTVQLASAFLFTVGFHTKKSVRGDNFFFNSLLLSECKYFHRDFLFFLFWLSKYRIWTIVFGTKILVLQHLLNHPCNS
jgi:hypothetical protein